MALNWNVSDVAKHEELFNADGRMIEPYASIIMSTMVVGLGTITESNYIKFYNRLSVVESLNGAYLWEDRTPRPITRDEVKRMIGLRVNVSNITKSQFMNNMKSLMPNEL